MGIIKQARNNKERQDTYRYQLGRYRKAINNEFYFEAMIIIYALLEDRLKSFLYYCGVFVNRNTLKLNGKIRTNIVQILYGHNVPPRIHTLNNISTKILFCERILDWTETVKNEDIENNEYLMELKRQIESLDIGGLKGVLGTLTNKDTGWLAYRNEIIHASMNKNIEALYKDLKDQAERGMELARFIDSQVRIMKNKGNVRKCLKLQNN